MDMDAMNAKLGLGGVWVVGLAIGGAVQLFLQWFSLSLAQLF